MDEWLNILWPFHTMGHYSATKKERIIDTASNWMNLQERWVKKDWSHSPCKAPSNMWHSITLAILSVSESKSDSCSVVSNSLRSHGLYPPVPLMHWILQARILEWVAILFSGACSPTWDRTWVSCTASRFFTFWAILLVRSKSLGPAYI